MSRHERKQILVDSDVQKALLRRVGVYWFFCLFTVAMLAACWFVLTERPSTSSELFDLLWSQCGPVLIASVLVLPIVLVDAARLSNRFAGPAQRLLRAMNDAADGKPTQPLKFRDNDFWSDFAEAFNRLQARLPHGPQNDCDLSVSESSAPAPDFECEESLAT